MIQTISFSSNPGRTSDRGKHLTLSDYVRLLGIEPVDYYHNNNGIKENAKTYVQLNKQM